MRLGRFSYAIARHNITLTLAFISNLCGIAGDTTAEIAGHLNRRELSQLYQLLIELDSVRLGRATALLFLTDAHGVVQVIVRGIVRRLVLNKARSA